MRQTVLQRGFTLVELVMVIVIMGVIGGIVSVFMKSPIDAYFASARRAAMTDVADTAVRRISRDLHKALPNSIRTPSTTCVEFIPTKTGGRYRAQGAGALSFVTPGSTSFNMLGSNLALPLEQRISQNDVIVVYNLGITGSDAYQIPSVNTATVNGAVGEAGTPVETTIPIASTLFPLESGSNRFHVVPGGENVVSYVCNAANELRRTVSTFVAAASTSCPATGPILAKNVNSCVFAYDSSDQRNALVQLKITLTDDSSGESVSLYHEVHVDNTP